MTLLLFNKPVKIYYTYKTKSTIKMNYTPDNAHLAPVIDTIADHPIYDRFLTLLKDYTISKIYDCHSHVSSGPNDMITDVQLKLRPKFPFSIKDTCYFYDQLFVRHGIETVSVVFDTPLPVYDMAKKNEILLNDPDVNTETNKRIIPFAVITPDMNGKQIASYLEMGAKGFKATPRTPSSQTKKKSINEISLFDMLHPAALQLADAHRLPFIVHLPALVVSTRNRDLIKDELVEIVNRYPQIKMVLAHLGQAQTPCKVKDLMSWIEVNNLSDRVWMDVSAVTVSSVFADALTGKVELVYGTDNDFALVEHGRYVTYKMKNGKRVLAFDDISDKAITALVSTHFGEQLKAFVKEQGVDLSMPMIVAQWEGILDAVDAIRKSGMPDTQIKWILENLFFRNAEELLGVHGGVKQ